MKICEFQYNKLNRSYCWHDTTRCFSIDEYQYDTEFPQTYIRICKFDEHFKNSTINFFPIDDTYISEILPGWLSVCACMVSITFMIISLVTYLLFKEMRNIPGWNVVNLTLALIIATSSFLSGSFVSSWPEVCFSISLIAHFGFMACFCWMNVIAFDFYRNFRKNASHILLNTITAKDRLPKYLLYGWCAPVLLVSITFIIDLVLGETDLYSSSLRPCYAQFLKGCNNLKNETVHLNNLTSRVYYSNDTCTEERPPRLIYMRSCWIHNGHANLLFFGLPILAIIIANGIFFFLTICNIRNKKRIQKKSDMRRFSKVKLPVDQDLKLYIQMASIMGFTWISGFVLQAFPTDEIFTQIFTYLFILANGCIGPFIFFAFIFRPEVKFHYIRLFNRLCSREISNKSKILMKMRAKNQVRPERSSAIPSVCISVGECSTSNLTGDGGSRKEKFSLNVPSDSSLNANPNNNNTHEVKDHSHMETIESDSDSPRNSEHDEVFF
jgi:G protein-coupled receptor Mth (Methuselah protein)